jgi:hypothetical protein
MKKFITYCATLFLIMPRIAGAIPDTLSSSPFTFESAGVITQKQINSAQTFLKYRSNAARGFVTIQYSLPQSAQGATLNIYNLSGVRVASYNLRPGLNSIYWGVNGRKAAAGVYLAAMRFGNVEKKIQISIVK